MAQMTIVDRNSIEDGLRRGLSIPEIAKPIGRPPQTPVTRRGTQASVTGAEIAKPIDRPPQTVTNEIKSRCIDSAKGLKPTNATCRWYGECKRTQV